MAHPCPGTGSPSRVSPGCWKCVSLAPSCPPRVLGRTSVEPEQTGPLPLLGRQALASTFGEGPRAGRWDLTGPRMEPGDLPTPYSLAWVREKGQPPQQAWQVTGGLAPVGMGA